MVEYSGAFGEHANVQYKAVTKGIKENIVLEQYTEVNEFKYLIDAQGLVPNVDEGSVIEFLDEDTKESVFRLNKAWAMDSFVENDQEEISNDDISITSSEDSTVNDLENSSDLDDINKNNSISNGNNTDIENKSSILSDVTINSTTLNESTASGVDEEATGEISEAKHFEDDIIYRLEKQNSGQYLLTMVINKEFLSNPDTVYPVLIDPSITHGYSEGGMPYNTFFSGTSETWPSYAYEYIQVGYRSGYGEGIGYIQFQNLDRFTFINPALITRATVIANQAYGGSSSYNISSYDSNTSANVYNTSYSVINNNLGTRQDTTTCGANGVYGWWITDIFKAWLGYERSGVGWNTYQCMIRATNPSTSNSYKQFYCSNNNLYLQVDYNTDSSQVGYSGGISKTMAWVCVYEDVGLITSFISAKPARQNVYIQGVKNNSANSLNVSSIDSFGYINTEPKTANDYLYNIQYSYENNNIKLNGTDYTLQTPPNSVLVSPSWRYDWDVIYPNRTISLSANSEVRSVGIISSLVLDIAVPWYYLNTIYTIE